MNIPGGAFVFKLSFVLVSQGRETYMRGMLYVNTGEYTMQSDIWSIFVTKKKIFLRIFRCDFVENLFET